jgi:hypothetical protein
VLEDKLFRFDFGQCVAVDAGRIRFFRLVGAVMIAGLVDPQRTDVNESPEAAGLLCFAEEMFQPVHIGGAIILDRPPVADLGRTMHNNCYPRYRSAQRSSVGHVAGCSFNAQRVEKPRIGSRTHERADAQPLLSGAFDHVAADQPVAP